MLGSPPRDRVRTFWQFAKCDADLVGDGYKSDGSDAATQSIYYEGQRVDSSADGMAYSKWEALCNSPH